VQVTGAASIATVAGAVYIKYNSVSKVMLHFNQYRCQLWSGVLVSWCTAATHCQCRSCPKHLQLCRLLGKEGVCL